jgi:SAM-dependent methyltransferase
MDHEEVGAYWNGIAKVWTELARAGFDLYRDYLNTPAFFEMLPDVRGLAGLDIGCGEGHNTRLLAKRGGCVTAMDVAEGFIAGLRCLCGTMQSKSLKLTIALMPETCWYKNLRKQIRRSEKDKLRKKVYSDQGKCVPYVVMETV